jgi:hypothetical protein
MSGRHVTGKVSQTPAGTWAPRLGDLAYDSRTGRTGTVVDVPGADVYSYHLSPTAGEEWTAPADGSTLSPGPRLVPCPAGTATGTRLLYPLNVTNPGRMWADSGWVFADLLVPALIDLGVQVTVAGPVAVSDPRAGHVPVAAPATKYRARFGHDVAGCADLLGTVRPDVVVANQVETAPGWRAAMLEAGVDARLVGYCHYLPYHLDEAGTLRLDVSLDDAGLGRTVLLAFFAGVLACDRVMVHSVTGRNWILAGADLLGLDLGDRVRIVPAPADPRLVRTPQDPPPAGRPVGVYNHRLYEHYGTGLLVQIAHALALAGSPVRLAVTDLLGARRRNPLRLDDSPRRYRAALRALPNVSLTTDTCDRHRYRRLLATASFAIAPLRANPIWSMSVIDCLTMGLPLLVRPRGWLAEIADPQLSFEQPHEAVTLIARLCEDPDFAATASKRCQTIAAGLAPAVVATAYLAAVTE